MPLVRMTSARWARLPLLGALLLGDAARAITHDALPAGARVREGGVEIAGDARGMRIRQSSEHAIIDWQSFDIGRDVSVRVFQHANAALLNRVRGDTTSTIAGELSATSTVHLVNPNGIHIASTGSVSAVGFVAATLDVTDADFLERAWRFGSVAGPVTGVIGVEGRVTIEPGGFVALVGHRIEHRGLIRSFLGETGLGVGQVIRVAPGQETLLEVALPGAPPPGRQAAIVVSGTIEADGGRVQIVAPVPRAATVGNAIDLRGVVRARHAFARPGTILVKASGGTVRMSGRLDAGSNDMQGTQGTGGIVNISALRVVMEDGSIDVSGELGGGYAWVTAGHARDAAGMRGMAPVAGPDGDGSADPLVSVGPSVRIDVAATHRGDGGEARFASAGRMVFLAHGQVFAAPAADNVTNRVSVVADGVVSEPLPRDGVRASAASTSRPVTPSTVPPAVAPSVPASMAPPVLRRVPTSLSLLSLSPPVSPSATPSALLPASLPTSLPASPPHAGSGSALQPASWRVSERSSAQSSAPSSPAASHRPSFSWHASPDASLPHRGSWHSSPDTSASNRMIESASPTTSEPLPQRGRPASPAFSERPSSGWHPSPVASEMPSVRWTPSPAVSLPPRAISRARTAFGHRPDEPRVGPPPFVRTWSGNGMPAAGRD